MPESDLILLQRFRDRRDELAFAQIVQRNAGTVLAACRRVLGDHARAEEVAQETFYLLLRKPEAVRTSLAGWLHRAATRLAIDTVRSDTARLRRELAYARRRERRVSTWQDLSPYVDESLDELPEPFRTILILHFLEGVPQHELAKRFKVSPPTMSRRVKQALAALRHRLRRKGMVVAAAALAVLLQDNAAQAASVTLLTELSKMAMISGFDASGASLTPSLASRMASTASRVGARFTSAFGDVSLTFAATCLLAVALATTGFLIDHHDSFDDDASKPPAPEKHPHVAHQR